MRSFRAALPPPARALLGAELLFWLAEGLAFPFLLVYLHGARHLDLRLAGLLAAWVGLVGLIAAPHAGRLIDHRGPHRVLALGLVVAAAGAALLAHAGTALAALVACTLLGVAAAAVQPAAASLLTRLVDEAGRSTAFSWRYVVVNVGMGLGGVLGGLVAHPGHPASFTALYTLQAVLLGAAIVLLARVPLPPAPGGTAHGRVSGRSSRGPSPLSDTGFRGAWAMAALSMGVGVMQLAHGFSFYALHALHLSPKVVGIALGANALLIVLLQLPVTRALGGRRRTEAMALLFALWAAAWLVLLGAAFAPEGLRAPLVVLVAMLFALGETMLAPSLGPLVAALAPEGALGRYNAALSVATILGKTVAPLPAATLLSGGLAPAFFALMLLGCAAGGVVAVRTERRLPTRVNVMAGSP